MAEKLSKTPWPFVGGSYEARSRAQDCSRTVNLYPELHSYGAGKNGDVAALYGTSGLRRVQTIGLGPIRQAYTLSSTNLTFIVSGNELYQLSAAQGTPVLVTGNLTTSTGYVSMADNGNSLLLVDGAHGYTVDLTVTPVLTTITSPNFFNGARTVTYQGGYFILDKPDSSNFFISDIDAATFSAGNEYSASASPDPLKCVISNNQQLYTMGTRTIEVWSLTGTGISEIFTVNQGRVMQFGVTAVGTVQRVANIFFWLGANDQGDGVIYSMENDTPTRVSTHAIEYHIQQLGDLSTATAYGFQENGHYFYCLNLPGADTTWVYDMEAKQWHERQSLISGVIGRNLGSCHAFLNGEHLVGDYRNGNVYVLDNEHYYDNDEPVRRIRQTPHSSDGVGMMFYKTLQVDIQPGVGSLTVDPRLVLQISRDGGHTWGNPIYGSMGKVGEYIHRARWQRLGRGRDLVFRVQTDAPVKCVFLAAYLDVEQGTM